MPKLLRTINKEHDQIEQIVKLENISLLVSDNRYGCWSATAPSVLITHQINILMSWPWKWLEPFIQLGNHKQIRKFTECWVPDFPGGITGKLTSTREIDVKFIGMVSRFIKMDIPLKYDVLALISGPEPQRTLFEEKITKQLSTTRLNFFVVKGKPGSENLSVNEVDHLNAQELNQVIESSAIVISRSGYTTIMDLCKLGKKAIFIPTPGQTEQEYLAEELERKGITFYQAQADFDINYALKQSENYKGFAGYQYTSNLLANAIDNLLYILPSPISNANT